MRLFNNRLLLTAKEKKQAWDGLKDESVKLGTVAFPFDGKVEEETVSLAKGDEVYYQYGTNIRLDDEEYVLVRISDLVCQK
jgi:co-chaperonin GroES (HSP10)